MGRTTADLPPLDYQCDREPPRTTGRSPLGLHVAALVTAALTFPLICLGGLVTSHGAGLSVPDWPNSYGYNMFLYPPNRWVGGILYEHTHRLLGTVVGFCAIVLTAAAWGPARTAVGRRIIRWSAVLLELANAAGTAAMVAFPAAFHLPESARSAGKIVPQGVVGAVAIGLVAVVARSFRRREPRAWVRWLATSCLVAVCVQGVIGGLRVDLINLTLAIVHGCFAQLTFCLMVVTAVVTGPWWGRAPDLSHGPVARRNRRLVAVAAGVVAVVYGQLIVGAIMRHEGAGLAIPQLIFPYGHLLPPTTADGLAAANHVRAWDLTPPLPRTTLGGIWLAYAHRLGAAAVSAAVLTVVGLIFARHRRQRGLTVPAALLTLLLVAQVTLGLLTVHYRKAADVASTHVAVGALVLATSVVIAVRAARLYSLRPAEPAAAPEPSPLELAAA